MKHFLLFCFLLLWQITLSQDIVDFFQMVPDSVVFNLSTSQREVIANNSKDYMSVKDAHKVMNKTKAKYAFESVNESKTYLKLIGSFEGQFQMSYWNLPSGNQLIAVYKESCGPICFVNSFVFYEFDGEGFVQLPFISIISLEENDFLKEDNNKDRKAIEDQELIATLLYQLPEKGEDILAKWGNEAPNEFYKEYARGNRIRLKWQNGEFIKSKIFWN